MSFRPEPILYSGYKVRLPPKRTASGAADFSVVPCGIGGCRRPSLSSTATLGLTAAPTAIRTDKGIEHVRNQGCGIHGFVEPAVFGGVPGRGIYDNMKTAVDRVGRGKERQVNIRFLAMTNHYVFAPEFCNPARMGKAKGRRHRDLLLGPVEERIEAIVSIGLQDATELSQMSLRMLGPADHWRRRRRQPAVTVLQKACRRKRRSKSGR